MIRHINDRIKTRRYYFLLLFSVTIIFLILYHQIIFGEKLYLFADIGGDTIHLGYPEMFVRSMIQNGIISSGYVLQQGLGLYMPESWFNFLDPLNLIYLFATPENMLYAKVIVLYLQYLMLALFSFLFFQRHLKNSLSCFIASMVWTFSGYVVLWGQHNFSISLAYFTMSMYFLQCFLEKKRRGILLVLSLAWLAYYSYYYFYMAGIFCACYVIGYCVIKKVHWGTGIKKLLILAGTGVFACGLSAVQLVPALYKFFISARTNVPGQRPVGLFHNREYLISLVGRFISNDTFGTGNDFWGYYNYYEAAMLVTSALAVPAIIVLLHTKYKKPTFILSLFGIVSLITPVTSYILNFDARKPRWTFMLVFLMVFAIGLLIDGIINHTIEIKIIDVWSTLGIYMLISLCLLWTKRTGIAGVKKWPVICVLFFVFLYSVLLLCSKYRFVPYYIAIVVVLEVMVLNYNSINQRMYLSETDFEQAYYNDGTSELVDYADKIDSGVYRINKTYDSVFYNDAVVQGYNGLAVYDPTNSECLVEYYQDMDMKLLNGKIHYVRIPADRSIWNTLLGVKYIIARDGDIVPENYQDLYSTNEKTLYLNQQALGFGYIYGENISSSSFKQLSTEDKDLALTRYYYLTEEDRGKDIVSTDLKVDNVEENLNQLRKNSAYNVVQTKKGFQFDIYNSYEDGAMLCVPVIYNSQWRAYINGEDTECVNVNGGLLAIDMSAKDAGEYNIEIVHEAKEYKIGIIISIVAVIIYLLICILWFRKGRIDVR